MKKYLDKRWVATVLIPDTPPRKHYRKPETWVIENIYSGKLFVPLDVGQTFRALPNPRLERLSLIKRVVRDELSSGAVIDNLKTGLRGSPDLIHVEPSNDESEQIYIPNDTPSDETTKVSTKEDYDDSGNLYGEQHGDDLGDSAKHDSIPGADEVALRSCSSNRKTVFTSGLLVSPATPKEDWEHELILLVCDIGTQTE